MKNTIRLAVAFLATAYIFPHLEPYTSPYITSQSISFTIIGFIIFFLVHARASPKQETAQKISSIIEEKKPVEVTTPSQLKAKELGDRFEEHLVRLIDKRDSANNFKLVEWRSDKYIEEINCFPRSSSLPDLEYLHKPSGKRIAFECKWRYRWIQPELGEDKIEIVAKNKTWKIKHYKEYDKDPNLVTYLAIGLGWNNDLNRPLSIRYMPLSKVGENYNLITKSWLEEHEENLHNILN
ncbi:MAG: hypothetical protein ABGY95_06165 [Rubritalea sp.]